MVASLQTEEAELKKLRVSVTDRYNMSCLFCMPDRDNIRFIPKDEMLSFDEITRITKIFSSMSIKKIRITGGEPLLREDLELLVGYCSNLKSDNKYLSRTKKI